MHRQQRQAVFRWLLCCAESDLSQERSDAMSTARLRSDVIVPMLFPLRSILKDKRAILSGSVFAYSSIFFRALRNLKSSPVHFKAAIALSTVGAQPFRAPFASVFNKDNGSFVFSDSARPPRVFVPPTLWRACPNAVCLVDWPGDGERAQIVPQRRLALVGRGGEFLVERYPLFFQLFLQAPKNKAIAT